MEKTFESALKRITEIADLLDSPDISLDDSLKLFKEASELIAFGTKQLEDAKLKIEEYSGGVKTGEGGADEWIQQ